MIERSDPKTGPGRIELTNVADFRLGALRVRPARRQLVAEDGATQDIEPRVMKVLVALADARPEVVSRDTLIERCWDGRIVGDDAINRCILALRHLARDHDPQPFSIETFPRVGYGMTARGELDDASATEPAKSDAARPAPAGIDRRVVLGASAAGFLAIAGGAYWLFGTTPSGPRVSSANANAAAWYQKGIEAREQGLPHLFTQAEANFQEAVRDDPNFIAAWEALALAYTDSLFIEEGNNQIAAAERARSAAQRALQLDPGSLTAQAALILIPSEFGIWGETQDNLRNLLAQRPDEPYLNWLLHMKLAYSLSGCGRASDALALTRSAVALKPLLPQTWAHHIYCLWAAGALTEAERESADKVARWPSHAELWVLRMALLTHSGRPSEAVAYASVGRRPPYIDSEGRIERWQATAQALASNRPEDIALASRLHLERITTVPQEMLPAARFFTATGRLDMAFEILDAYYFNRGRFAVANRPPRTPLTRMNTISLFWPPMAPARGDPRFARLAEEIGLERYWRDTGSIPDFRRA